MFPEGRRRRQPKKRHYDTPEYRKIRAQVVRQPICQMCGFYTRPEDRTCDHFPPLSERPQGPWLYRMACKTCQAKQGARLKGKAQRPISL